MQIYEITADKKTLKEYDPNRSPGKKNYGTGVGPGVQPQYTATPGMKTAPQPRPTPQLPSPPTTAAPKLQTINAPAQLTGPKSTPAKQIGTNYDPNVIDVDAKVKPDTPPAPQLSAPAPATAPVPNYLTGNYNQTSNAPTANVPATNTVMPTNMSATDAPVPDVQVTPTSSKSSLPPTPPPAKFDPLGSAVKAMVAHNANQSGVGWLNKDNHIPKVRQNAVTGAILVDGKPYDPKNPAHVNAYREWTYGHRGNERVEIGKDGEVTIDGKPYNANNPKHVAAYKNKLNPVAKAIVQPTVPAPAPKLGTPSAPNGVEAALIKLGYSQQGAAAMAAKVPPGTSEQDAIKMALAGKLNESLSWSRRFDPSATLLKKMKSQ